MTNKSLFDFTDEKRYDCSTCFTPHQVYESNGAQWVKCGVSGVREMPKICNIWREKDILAGCPDAPDFTPKKYLRRG
jgi:hypothetical protein